MQEAKAETRRKTKKYTIPRIIYEGQITTRAGTPTGGSADNDRAVDPADLFRQD